MNMHVQPNMIKRIWSANWLWNQAQLDYSRFIKCTT